MKSKEKGDLAVAYAIAYYVEKGYEVLTPLGDKKPYDIVLEKNNVFTRVQCKYTGSQSKYGIYSVGLRVMGGNQSFYTAKNYGPNDFDILFVFTKNKDMYEFDRGVWSRAKSTLSLGKKYIKYKI